MDDRDRATTARRSARSTSPSTTWPATDRRRPGPRAARPVGRHPADRLHDRASTSRPVVAERAGRAARFPALKIKLGGPADLETLEAVRGVYGGPIRVDANTGWSLDGARRLLPELVRLGVELIEQPFPARRLDDLAALQAESPLPIVADESAVTIDDLDGLVGVVAGVNVKLAKCGGVGPAARMLARARELGFRTFLGCMEETSVGIAASAAVASLADWVDLDGNLLLAADPFERPRARRRLPLAAGRRPGPRDRAARLSRGPRPPDRRRAWPASNARSCG